MTGMPTKIRKRNGAVVPFDPEKIENATRKANEAVCAAGGGTERMEAGRLRSLTSQIAASVNGKEIPTVEQVQDRVEEQLIAAGYAKTAKAYILYRAEHAKIRQAQSDLMDIYKELTFRDAKDADIKRENANIDADTAMGTMLKYGSEGSKYFINNYVLPKDVAAAHINGDIHIHDEGFYKLKEA